MKFKKFSKRFRHQAPPKVLGDICLIAHGTTLLHTILLNAKHQNLLVQPDESLYNLTPAELAQASRRLLPHAGKQHRIALALPSTEFVVTSLKLPTVAAQNLKNVVMLQLPSLLPGLTEDPPLLAVQAPTEGIQTYALWMPVKRANELFQAFDEAGLFLACILPRPVVMLPKTSSCQVHDEDDTSITYLEWSGSSIQHWLFLDKTECENEEFQTQLEETLETFEDDIDKKSKTQVDDWKDLPMPPPAAYGYAFIPFGAVLHKQKIAKQKKQRNWGFVAIFCLIAILVCFYLAIDYKQQLTQQLTELREQTDHVSLLRAEVGEIEKTIGPVKSFPRQQVVTILATLNQLIPKNSWLVSCRIEGGIIKLEGYSPNPTQLIEILTKEPQFIKVEQSRETRVEERRSELKFGISFKLDEFEFNLKNYWSEYFPEKRY